jgi:hypothetical protein
MGLYVKCTYVNKDKDLIFGKEDEFTEAFTDKRGELFRSCQKEFGKCVSKVYAEKADGTSNPVGWVFEGREQYTDTGETYIRQVWVEVKETDERDESIDRGSRPPV